jgi:hypothetical protein
MKKLIALCFIITALLPWQAAESAEKDRLELAFKLVEKTNMAKMFVDLAESSMESYFERYENPAAKDPAHANPLKRIFENEVNLGQEELAWMLAEIYAAHFTENELEKILAFFSSPAGQTWLDNKLTIQTEGDQIGLEWGQLLTRRVLKKFESQYGVKF